MRWYKTLLTRFPAPTVQKPLMISTRTSPVLTFSDMTSDSSSRGISFFNRSTMLSTMFSTNTNSEVLRIWRQPLWINTHINSHTPYALYPQTHIFICENCIWHDGQVCIFFLFSRILIKIIIYVSIVANYFCRKFNSPKYFIYKNARLLVKKERCIL